MAELQGVKVIDMKDGEVTKITYEGAEYVKLADKTENKKGDIALVVVGWGIQKEGEYYRLNNEDHPLWDHDSGGLVFIAGKTCAASEVLDSVEIFRKVGTETPTLDSRVTKLEQDVAELKSGEADGVEPKENTTYKKGDKIRVVAAEDTDEEYENGDVLTIERIDIDGDIYVKEHDMFIYPREVEPATPKVGDKVRVVAAELTYGEYENGDVLTIEFIDHDGNIDVKEHDRLLYRREYELMTTAEIKAWAQAQRLTVGDYAKVVDADTAQNSGTIPEGSIVKITEDDGSRVPYRIDSLITGVVAWAEPAHIVKATDEEVAEAKEFAKWAKIGRKPNEYKPGDIAEVVNSPNASPKGTFVEVKDVDSTVIYAVGWSAVLRRNTMIHYDRTDLKLITPVENRFDK